MEEPLSYYLGLLEVELFNKITNDFISKSNKYIEVKDGKTNYKFSLAKAVSDEITNKVGSRLGRNDKKTNAIGANTICTIIRTRCISESCKSETFHYICKYLGYSNLKDFKNKKSQSSHPTVKDIEGQQFFIYYFLNENFKPDKSLLVITDDDANLLFYNYSSGKRVEIARYAGKIIINKTKEISIFFSKYIEIGAEKPALVPSFCSFKYATADYKLGVYAAHKTTSCGVVVLEKVNENTYESKLDDLIFPTHVLSLIHNARYAATSKQIGNVWARKSALKEKFIKYKGVYEAFTIGSRAPLCIRKLIFEFFENGQVRFKSDTRPDEYGRIVSIRERIIIIQFGLDRENHYYKSQVLLDTINPVQSVSLLHRKTLIGIFGGIDVSFSDPMAGRILLYKIKDSFEGSDFKSYTINEETEIADFKDTHPISGVVIDFLRGKYDVYADSPYNIEKQKFNKIRF